MHGVGIWTLHSSLAAPFSLHGRDDQSQLKLGGPVAGTRPRLGPQFEREALAHHTIAEISTLGLDEEKITWNIREEGWACSCRQF